MLLSTVFSPSYLLIWAGTVEVRRTVLVQDWQGGEGVAKVMSPRLQVALKYV